LQRILQKIKKNGTEREIDGLKVEHFKNDPKIISEISELNTLRL
jgi:hypothetical protein